MKLALPTLSRRPVHLAAALQMIAATALFGVMIAMVKGLQGRYPIAEVMFMRSVFALAPIGLIVARGGIGRLATRHPAGHLIRSALGLMGMTFYFWASPRLPLGDQQAIRYLSPPITGLFAVLFLGEVFTRRRWAALGVGLVGMLLLARPSLGLPPIATGVAVTGAVVAAAAMVAIRALGEKEPASTTAFWFAVASATASGVFLPFVWKTPSPVDFAVLAGIGLFGGLAQILMTNAYRSAPVHAVAPFEFFALVWACLIGFAVWGEVPSLLSVVGMALVVAAGALTTGLGRRTALAPSQAPPAEAAGSGEVGDPGARREPGRQPA